MAIQLNTHLKRMIVKASTMGWSVNQIHIKIDEILEEYGVKNKRMKPADKQIQPIQKFDNKKR